MKIALLEFSLLVFIVTFFKCRGIGWWIMWLVWKKTAKHTANWRVNVRRLTACKLYDGRLWIGVIWLKKELVAGCIVHVNEISFSRKFRGINFFTTVS